MRADPHCPRGREPSVSLPARLVNDGQHLDRRSQDVNGSVAPQAARVPTSDEAASGRRHQLLDRHDLVWMRLVSIDIRVPPVRNRGGPHCRDRVSR